MTAESVVLGSCAVLAYVGSAALDIELPDGRRVTAAAAFAGALAALGFGGFAILPTVPLALGGAVGGFVVVLVSRRRLLVSASHLCGCLLAFAMTAGLGFVTRSEFRSPNGRTLLVACLATCGYFVIETAVAPFGKTGTRWSRASLRETAKTAIPLAVVLVSTAGLVVMVFHRLHWLSFVIMFVPVLASRYEFGRYRETRMTYEQTVRALSALSEGAGYVPQGHQRRVAELCVRIGQQLGLAPEALHRLELVALLHDVGAVSLPDPMDVARASAAQTAQSSAELLEETGYLAEFADIVRAAAAGDRQVALEGRILRVANHYDQLDGSASERLAAVSVRALPSDTDVVKALGQSLAVRVRAK